MAELTGEGEAHEGRSDPPGTTIQNLPSTARVAAGAFGFLALIHVFEVLAKSIG
jgi:hypothetical protein